MNAAEYWDNIFAQGGADSDNRLEMPRAADPVLCRALQLSALELASLGPVDFVFGAMILHHPEPFAEFASALRATLAPDGEAFFWENNARSSLMIWCRDHLVGRSWIPKYGDDDEFPLTPDEVAELRRHSICCAAAAAAHSRWPIPAFAIARHGEVQHRGRRARRHSVVIFPS